MYAIRTKERKTLRSHCLKPNRVCYSFESCHSKSEEVGLYRHEKQPGGAANPNVAPRCGWIDLLERKQRQTRLIDSVSGVYRGIRALLSVSITKKLVQSESAYATVFAVPPKIIMDGAYPH